MLKTLPGQSGSVMQDRNGVTNVTPFLSSALP